MLNVWRTNKPISRLAVCCQCSEMIAHPYESVFKSTTSQSRPDWDRAWPNRRFAAPVTSLQLVLHMILGLLCRYSFLIHYLPGSTIITILRNAQESYKHEKRSIVITQIIKTQVKHKSLYFAFLTYSWLHLIIENIK